MCTRINVRFLMLYPIRTKSPIFLHQVITALKGKVYEAVTRARNASQDAHDVALEVSHDAPDTYRGAGLHALTCMLPHYSDLQKLKICMHTGGWERSSVNAMKSGVRVGALIYVLHILPSLSSSAKTCADCNSTGHVSSRPTSSRQRAPEAHDALLVEEGKDQHGWMVSPGVGVGQELG